MCGRFGSTLTVCDSPMWLVSPISTGFATSVTSTSSSPPCFVSVSPSTPWSWQRPLASEASTSSSVSVWTAEGLATLRIAPPLGAASTSCWRPVAAAGLEMQLAEGCAEMYWGSTVSPWVSWTIVCPPAFGPIPSVPTEAKVSPPWVKKSRSVCGLPVAIVSISSHSAPWPPDITAPEGGLTGSNSGAGWSSR